MMKKNILLLLIGLFTLISCEEDINEMANKQISIEQFSPVLENGEMKLSGSVTFPEEFDRETAKVGFYLQEYREELNYWGELMLDSYTVYDAYERLISGEEAGNYYNNDEQCLWIDEVNADGTFETSFMPQIKQYVCTAFALNVLESSDDYYGDKYQVVCSKPFFFTGEATAKLDLVPLWNQFKMTYVADMDIEVGLCWSATNPLPNLEDNVKRVDSYNIPGNLTTVYFEDFDFGDHDIVYLRGYVRKQIEPYTNNTLSYKMTFSNVIEFRPKEQVVTVETKDDFQKMMFEDRGDGTYYYRGDKIWNNYRGKIQFKYEVQKEDWIDIKELAEWGDTTYISIYNLNCSIEGKGIIPYVGYVSSTGKISGMTLEEECRTNYGMLENLNNLSVTDNYGSISNVNQLSLRNNEGKIMNCNQVVVTTNNSEISRSDSLFISDNNGIVSNSSRVYISWDNNGQLIDSNNIFVYGNNGLVQDCKDIYEERRADYGPYMVYSNRTEGKIIDCSIANNDSINSHIICRDNSGYMENCLPDSVCCITNHGVIKNSK